MEVNVLWMSFLFSCLMLYIGFSKKFYGDLAFQMFGGMGLVVTGVSLAQVSYIGWTMMNVDIYTIKADMYNGLGNVVVSLAFCLLGVLVMLKASLTSWKVRAESKDKYAGRMRYGGLQE